MFGSCRAQMNRTMFLSSVQMGELNYYTFLGYHILRMNVCRVNIFTVGGKACRTQADNLTYEIGKNMVNEMVGQIS